MTIVSLSDNRMVNIDSILEVDCLERSGGEIKTIEVTFKGLSAPQAFEGTVARQIWDQLSKRAREKNQGHEYDELRLNGPLSASTHKDGRNLVIVSAISLLIAKFVLIPKAFSAFGISFLEPSRQSTIVLLFFLLSYFMFSFALRALSDSCLWKKKLAASQKVSGGLLTNVSYAASDLRNVLELAGSVALAIWAFVSLASASLA
jgi:hypothetical protein